MSRPRSRSPAASSSGCCSGSLTYGVMALLRDASRLAKLIATLGLFSAGQAFMILRWGLGVVQPESLLPSRNVTLWGDLRIGLDRLMLIGIALACAAVLRLVYSRTLFGLATSAVAENRRVAASAGWSPNRIELVNFAVAGGLSALAAILLAPIVTLNAAVLSVAVLPALAAALVGRFSSFGITVAAALLIGVVQSEIPLFQPDIAEWLGVSAASLTGLVQAVPLAIILGYMVVTGRSRLQRGETVARLPLPGSGGCRCSRSSSGSCLGAGLLVGVDTWTDALITTFALAIIVTSVVVVAGYAGQLSLCQFALAGVGAWMAARLMSANGWPFEAALLAAVAGTTLVGVVDRRTRRPHTGYEPRRRHPGHGADVQLAALHQQCAHRRRARPADRGGVVRRPRPRPARAPPALRRLRARRARPRRPRRRQPASRPSRRPAARGAEQRAGRRLARHRRRRPPRCTPSPSPPPSPPLGGVLLSLRQANVQFGQYNVFGSVLLIQYAVVGGIAWVSGAVVAAVGAPGALGALIFEKVVPDGTDIISWLAVLSGFGAVTVLRQAPDGIAALWARAAAPGHRAVPAPPPTARRGAGRGAAPTDRPPPPSRCATSPCAFGGVVALDGVSFQVEPGEVVGLIGPNGAGKTTLLDVVTGFTPAGSGSVSFDGAPIDGWSVERRARAGIVRSWQAVELFEEMTVRDNLLVAADDQSAWRYLIDLVRPGRRTATPLVDELVEEFGLGDVLDERPSSLPHGVSRLVGIARALVTEPAVLLLDEPAAGLDSRESGELGAAIRAMASRRGIGILVVEHDVALLLQTCDRIVVLDFGRKIAEGTPDEVSGDAGVIEAYLGDCRGDALRRGRRRDPAARRSRACAPATARSRWSAELDLQVARRRGRRAARPERRRQDDDAAARCPASCRRSAATCGCSTATPATRCTSGPARAWPWSPRSEPCSWS